MSDSCDPMDCSLPGFSVGFPSQEYWNGLLFPSSGHLPNPGIKPVSCVARGFFTDLATGKAQSLCPCPGWGERVQFHRGSEKSLILVFCFFFMHKITDGKLGALLCTSAGLIRNIPCLAESSSFSLAGKLMRMIETL